MRNEAITKIAASAFWSLTHPLNRAYRRAHGKYVEGVNYPADFSLSQLIEFAEELPPEVLAAYAVETAGAALVR